MTPLSRVNQDPLEHDFTAWLDSLTESTQEVGQRIVATGKLEADDIDLSWFVVETVEDEPPELVKFNSYEALVMHVTQRAQQPDVRMLVFWGASARLTRGQYKFLVHPNGERVPLFHIPTIDEMEFDDNGRFTVTEDEAIPEVTELNLGGQTMQLSASNSEDEAVGYDDDEGDYDEYDEVEDDTEFEDEEPEDALDDEEEELDEEELED